MSSHIFRELREEQQDRMGRGRSTFVSGLVVAMVFVVGSFATASEARASVVAFDMVESASQNLLSFTEDPAIPFASAGDAFNKLQRGVSPTIPFAVVDDSAGVFPPDTLGIIKTGNTDEFFGVVDTTNPDTGGAPVTATWVFGIAGVPGLSLSIDMGAMGDFEASDHFVWEYSIDGGPVLTAFENTVDEAGSYTYILESGTAVTLNDPMLVDGTVLTNDLATFTVPLTGSGSTLTLTLTATTDGGSEAIAFQDIVIEGAPSAAVAFDMVESASQNLLSFTEDPAIPFASAGDAFNKLQRGVSPTIPFAVVDDSAGVFPPDTLGIIKTGNTDEFFGVVDTTNPDTGGAPVTATWVFGIAGVPGLSLSIDMGAMGDFEASDHFVWEYSIDGGPVLTAFENTVDEAGSYTYILESGTAVTLNDPMLVDGTVLTNDLATFTVPLTGSGSTLTLSLTATTDSGAEAIAFQDIVIRGSSSPPLDGDVDGDGDVDRDDIAIVFATRGTIASGPDDPRDMDGDGLITVGDGRLIVYECTRPMCATE